MDQENLAELFDEHRTRLRSVAYRMLGSQAEADDAVQEVWLRLSRSDADDIAANPRFDAWGEGLFRIERVKRYARALGRQDLERKVGERISRIDPEFKWAHVE